MLDLVSKFPVSILLSCTNSTQPSDHQTFACLHGKSCRKKIRKKNSNKICYRSSVAVSKNKSIYYEGKGLHSRWMLRWLRRSWRLWGLWSFHEIVTVRVEGRKSTRNLEWEWYCKLCFNVDGVQCQEYKFECEERVVCKRSATSKRNEFGVHCQLRDSQQYDIFQTNNF